MKERLMTRTRMIGHGGLKRARDIFAFLCVLLSVSTVAIAGTPGCDDKDSSKSMWHVMIDYSEALRVRDEAWSTIMKQADSALGLTCFDQALALSSRLGAIFSDKSPDLDSAIAAVKSVIKGQDLDKLYNPYTIFGMKKDKTTGIPVPNTLADGYEKAMSGTLTNYLGGAGNFAYSLSSDMGATVTGALKGLVGDIFSSLDGILNDAGYGINAITSAVDSVFGWLNTLDDLLFEFNLDTGAGGASFSITGSVFIDSLLYQSGAVYTLVSTILSDANAAINMAKSASGAVNQAIDDFTNGILGSARASLSNLTDAAMDVLPVIPVDIASLPLPTSLPTGTPSFSLPTVKGLQGMLTHYAAGLIPPGCNQLAALWNGAALTDSANNVIGSLQGIVGGGITRQKDLITGQLKGIPYFSYADLVARNIAAADGPGSLLQSLSTAASGAILNKAQTDLNTLLQQPGVLPSWLGLSSPIPQNASVSVIIGRINNP